jgi:hypothetical protein
MKLRKPLFTFLLFINALFAYSQVTPLMTTTWNQGCYYNDSIPSDVSGPCGKVYTGCNATAMSQIMKYYSHPINGWGNFSYTDASYGVQSADFSSANYNWAAMTNNLTSSNSEISKIMRHTGVAVEMIYSPTVSNSFFDSKVFKEYFKYSLSIASKLKALYTNVEWETILMDELDAGRVVFVKGGSHFYVIDGYQLAPSLKFHTNFGWGGLYDGYYDIHSIIVASNNFTPNIVMVGITPLLDLDVSPDTLNISSNTGIHNFEVSSLNAWTATSNQTWATLGLTGGASGYYDWFNGATVSVTNNSSYSARFATLSFNDGSVSKTITVKQNGIAPYLSVNPTNLTYSSTGGTQTVSISTDSNWVATSSDPWLTLTPSSGTTSNTFDITAVLNPSSPTRTGAVTVTRGGLQQVINITQGGSGSTWCIPSITTPNSNGITNVTLNTINRTSPFDEGYIFTSDTTLLNLDSTYTIYVTFSGGNAPAIWIDWNQDGDFSDIGEDVLPASSSWYPSFNDTKNMSFTVPSSALEGLTRMRVYAKAFGTGPVSGPCGTTDNGGDIEDYTIKVKNSKYIDITPASLNYLSSGSGQNIYVECDSNWTVTTADSWLIISPLTSIGNSLVSVTVSANSSTIPRNGTATFSRGSFSKIATVYQAGEDSTIAIIPDTLYVSSIGGVESFSVTSNISYTISSNQSWMSSSLTTTSGNQSPDLVVSFNPTTAIRTGLIIATQGTISDSLIVIQDATSSVLTVSPLNLNFTDIGGDQNFNITTGSSWTASTTDSWFSINSNSGTGNSLLTVSCDTNFIATSRSGSVIITNGIIIQTLTVFQNLALTTLINENTTSSTFIIYPNPNSGYFIISSKQKNGTINIFNLLGEVVYQTLHLNEPTEISLQNLPNGVYIVELNNEKRKFIKD